MKNIIKIFLFFLLFTVALNFSTSNINAQTTLSTKPLYYGLIKNPDVKTVQQILISKGYLVGTPTGNFLSVTKKAIQNFQKANGIPTTGTVGPLTRTALLAPKSAPSPTAPVATTDTPTTPAVTTPTVTDPNDHTPPLISNGTPAFTTLPSGTTSTNISVTTDEPATCKYSTFYNPYNSMESTFDTTPSTTHTASVSNLKDGRAYDYYVQCRDTSNNTTSSNYTIAFSIGGTYTPDGPVAVVPPVNTPVVPTADTTPPSVPTGVTAVAASISQINLSWTASTDNVAVTGYKILQCSGSGCTPVTQIATSLVNSYNNTGLSSSTSYSYKVIAYDQAGNNSTASSVASATTSTPVAPSPSSPVITKSMPDGSITNAFTQTTITVQTNIGSYCRYSTTPNTPYASMTGMFNLGQYFGHQATVTGLTAGNTYTYYVRCADNTNKNPTTVDYPITFSLTDSTPVVNTEPVYSSSTDHLVMQDNMDEYTDINAMGALPVGTSPRIVPLPSPITTSQPVNTTNNQIIPGRGGTGNALRMSYAAPDGTQHSVVFTTMNNPRDPALSTHFWQYWARVTPSSPLVGALAIKWFEAWHASDRIQWNTHDHLGCPSYSHQTYWQVYEKSRATFCQADQPVGPYMNENISDGQWHRFTMEYRPNTSAGSRDGISRMWIDGTKVIDISISAVGVIPPGGEWPWSNMDDLDALSVNDAIVNVEWGSALTTAPPAFTYDIDDFTWWTKP